MARINVCDCCNSPENVKPFVMTTEGFKVGGGKTTRSRTYDPDAASHNVELCESCRTALQFKWDELSKPSGVDDYGLRDENQL